MTVSAPIPLPFDGGQWVKVRKLTGKQFEHAQAAHRAAFGAGNARAWSLTFRRGLEHGATDPEVLRAIHDPLTGFDRYELAKSGLVEWSYERALDAAAVDDLDDDAIDFIAREVLRVTKPALFIETAKEDEADTKKG